MIAAFEIATAGNRWHQRQSISAPDEPRRNEPLGAIGFDWIAASRGGVPWLISWPRKKLIEQHLPTAITQWLPKSGNPGLGIPVRGVRPPVKKSDWHRVNVRYARCETCGGLAASGLCSSNLAVANLIDELRT